MKWLKRCALIEAEMEALRADLLSSRASEARLVEGMREIREFVAESVRDSEACMLSSVRRRGMLPVPDDRPETLRAGAMYGWVIVMGNVEEMVSAILSAPASEEGKEPATKPCTCSSHQFVDCRGVEGLGKGWHCVMTGQRGNPRSSEEDEEPHEADFSGPIEGSTEHIDEL